VFHMMDRQDDARIEFRRVRSLEPDAMNSLNVEARAYLAAGHYDSAAVALRRQAELGGYSRPMEVEEYAEAVRAGRFAQARSIVSGWDKGAVFADYNLALYYHVARDREAAIRMLLRSFNKREAQITWAAVDPGIAPLREDPRIATVLRRLGLRDGVR